MRLPAKGVVHERIRAVGSQAYPIYAVQGDAATLLVDAGLNLLGPCYLSELTELPGTSTSPLFLFLTHSHYDHLGAAGYLKRHLPQLVIGAHGRVSALLEKPSALETMNRLSQAHSELGHGLKQQEELAIAPFPIEMPLHGKEELDLGGLTVRVFSTPGHTRDSLSFFIPEIGALFPGDACGEFKDKDVSEIQVQFVSSYEQYLESLLFLRSLHPALLCLAHGWVLAEEDASTYLDQSVEATHRYRALIESYLDATQGDVEEAVRRIVRDEYDLKPGVMQNRQSYVTNLEAQVRHLAGLRQGPVPSDTSKNRGAAGSD